MIWFLGIAGILLVLLGLWEGPAAARKRREVEAAAGKQPSSKEAWDIISRPLEDELIKIPQQTGGGDRRFVRGLLTGLGAGLMVASVAVSFAPRVAAPPSTPQVAAKEPDVTPPAAPPQGQTPPETQPEVTPEPTPEPPAPANVHITVEIGEAAGAIADQLKEKGLIADQQQFLDRLAERELETYVQAGTFVIPTGATLDEVIDHLTGQAG